MKQPSRKLVRKPSGAKRELRANHGDLVIARGTKQSHTLRDRHVVLLLAMTHECNDNI
jgi:alkylated DNA repair dioxygenase AlkB